MAQLQTFSSVDAREVVRHFYAREGVYDEIYGLEVVTIPDGSQKGALLIRVTPKRHFRFLDLPAELRDRIYAYALSDQNRKIRIITHAIRPFGTPKISKIKPVQVGFDIRCRHRGLKFDKKSAKWIGAQRSPLSLLLVNKQIHAESVTIAYGSPRFTFFDVQGPNVFAQTIGQSIKYITAVHIVGANFAEVKKICEALQRATGIRTISLSQRLILRSLRSGAEHSDDVYTWAAILNRAMSSMLLGAQATHRARGRSWRALDILQVECTHYDTIHTVYGSNKNDKAKIKEFLAAFRELANHYLKEEPFPLEEQQA